MLCPGRSASLLPFFPHTRIPGSETGYFCVRIAVHDMPRARGHICEGSVGRGLHSLGPGMWVNR